MSWCRTLAWILLVFVVVSGAAQTVGAQSSDDSRARAHFVSGNLYFSDGRFEDAAREFQEAFELSGRPEMLLNLAHAHDKGGHLEQAIADLELLLTRYPKTTLRPDVEGELADLRARKQAQDQAAAQASVPPEQPAPALQPPEQPAPAASSEATSQPAANTTVAKPHGKPWQRVGLATWIVAGGAVALGGVAIATGVVASGTYSDLQSSCKPSSCSNADHKKADSGKTMALVSTVSTFAAVGAAAAAVTMYFMGVGVPKERAVAFAPVVNSRQLGMAAQVAF